MSGSLPIHISYPAIGCLFKRVVLLVDGGEQQQLVNMRGVVVPASQVGRHAEGEMAEVVYGAGAGVVQGQEGFEAPDAVLVQFVGRLLATLT